MGSDRRGRRSGHPAVSGSAVVVLVVCAGDRADRIRTVVYALLLKGEGDEGYHFPAAPVSGENTAEAAVIAQGCAA